MARYTFGGSTSDFTFAVYTSGGRKYPVLQPATLTFWDAETGGTRQTVTLNGTDTQTVTVGTDGLVPDFTGPEGMTSLWADAGAGRVRMTTSDPLGALSVVAESGSYLDLKDKPAAPTPASIGAEVAGAAAAAQAAAQSYTDTGLATKANASSLGLKLDANKVGAANGVAPLGADSRVAEANLPANLAAAQMTATFAGVRRARPGTRVVFLGDSITAGSIDNPNNTVATCYPLFANLISGGRVLMARNAGVPGNLSGDMLGRFDTDVTPYSPSTVVVLAGTNDIGNSIAFSTYQANMRTIVAKTRAIGAQPVLVTIPPNNDTTRHPTIAKWNAWLRRYAAIEGLTILDFHAVLIDPTNGNYLAAYYTDGTHPNEAGYRALGQLVSDRLSPLLPDWRPPLVTANDDATTNCLTGNPLCITDTNADGVPDNCIAYGGSTGYTHALVTDSQVPGKMAQVTQSANAAQRILEWTVRNAAYAIGDTLAFSGVVTSDGGVKVDVKVTFQGANKSAYPARFTAAVTRGVFYQEVVVPTGTTGIVLDVVANAGTGVVSVGQVTVQNLTQLGILTP